MTYKLDNIEITDTQLEELIAQREANKLEYPLYKRWSYNGKIIKFNKGCEKLTGYAKEEVIGKKVFDLFIPEEQREDVRSVFESLLTKDFPKNYVNYWLTKSGEKKLISWHNACIKDDEDNIIFIISSGRDITELVDLRKQEREMLEQLNLLTNILFHQSFRKLFGKFNQSFF